MSGKGFIIEYPDYISQFLRHQVDENATDDTAKGNIKENLQLIRGFIEAFFNQRLEAAL
jgi:hypothetical protein